MTLTTHCRGRALLALVLVPAFVVVPETFADGAPIGPGGVRFDRLSVEHGLSQGTVNGMLQDRHGFMWFGTQEGLNRYDGYDVTVFRHDPDDSTSLSNDWIWALTEDRDGTIWVGTDGGGVCRRAAAGPIFRCLKQDPADPASALINRARSVLADAAGRIWVGTDGGLRVIDPGAVAPETGTRLGESGPFEAVVGDAAVRALAPAADGAIWAAADGVGLIEIDTESRTASVLPAWTALVAAAKPANIRSILDMRDGAVWVGTYDGGVISIRLENGDVVRYRNDPADARSLANDRIRDLFVDSMKNLWVATDGGLSLWRPATGDFTNFHHDAGIPTTLSDDRVRSLYQDRGGVLWVGTYAGLSHWNPLTGSFSHFLHRPGMEDGLSGNVVTAFAEDLDGSIWVGTYGAGVNHLDRGTGRFTSFRTDSRTPAGLSDDRIMSLLVDRRGRLWIGTRSNGLDRYDPATGTISHFRDDADVAGALSANGVTALLEDRNGTLWVGTYRGGLNRYDETTGRFTVYRHDPASPSSISDDRVLAIHEDRDGMLWIGTETGGLNRLDPSTGVFTSFHHDPSEPTTLSSDTAWTIHESADRVLWIGTQGAGLNRWAPEDRDAGRAVFRRYGRSDGLESATVYGILGDARGMLWLSTNRGLARMDPGSGQFRHFNTSHGIQSQEFNFGAFLAARDGEMFFGGVNGFNAFRPEFVRENRNPPPVVLTGIFVANEPLVDEADAVGLGSIDLGHRDNVVSFEFAGLDYTDPDKNRYRYMLEGFDTDWVDIGRNRRATYTNLPPGRFAFRVKASNNDGVWNDAGATLSVVVHPAPWRTWWAYSIYVVVIGSLIVGYLRHQRAELAREAASKRAAEEASRAKSQFLATVSHEIRTPMNGVLGMTELLLGEDLTSQQRRFTSSVLHSAEALLAVLNDMLDFSRIESGQLLLQSTTFDVVDLCRSVIDQLRELAAAKSLELRLEVPGSGPILVRGDVDRLRQVLLNLVSNAVKFTDAGSVDVRVEKIDETGTTRSYRFQVRDSGIGIPAERLSQIFECFAQADSSSTRRYGGVGLGLSIAKNLVDLMGGEIGCESDEGAGSVFWFTCPLTVHEGAVEEAVGDAERLAGRRILLAVADEITRTVLRHQVSGWLMTSGEATTVDTACAEIEKSTRAGDPYDIVVVEDRLEEGGKGLDVVKYVRDNPGLPQPEFVLLASVGPDVDRASADAFGVRRHLTTPIRVTQLRRCLSEVAHFVPHRVEPEPTIEAVTGTVLVVEDSPLNQEICSGILECAGIRVEIADNGEEALSRAGGARYDAILMDIQMPVMDGIEATRRIREREGDRHTPIIALTANATSEDRARCRAVGMDDFISKPFTQQQLLGVLRQWIFMGRHAG